MTVNDGVSPSPKGGGAERARSPLNPPLQSIVSKHWEVYMEHRLQVPWHCFQFC